MPKPRFDGRIVGGYPIEITDAPWQISLQLYGSHFCGGSIIGKNWVLTAGHCVAYLQSNVNNGKIRFGSTTHSNGGQTYSIKRAILHSKYNSAKIDFDYGLIELKDALRFDDRVQPITLPELDKFVEDDTTCTVTGWGNTLNSSESSSKLRAAEVPIVNQEICDEAYSKYGGVTPRMICAGNYKEGGKDGKYFISIDENEYYIE